MIDLNDELAQDYLADCREHLAAIEADLLALPTGGVPLDEARLSRIYRGVHFIWGGAAFFDLINILQLASKLEEAVTLVRSRNNALTLEQLRTMISATDKLGELIRHPVVGNKANIRGIFSELDRLLVRGDTSIAPAPTVTLRQQRRKGGPLKILLAEDDFACRLLLQTFLSRYGECHVAVNGKEAVDAFRAARDGEQPYDLICMDIMMPEMDGREAVRQVRATEEAHGILSTSGVKVIMTTTVEDIKEVILCFQELCDAYLMKPIDLAELLGLMRLYQLVP
jgi:two-component system chemotaxis response regulator CheY